jgi:L-cysteine/cystine lyase
VGLYASPGDRLARRTLTQQPLRRQGGTTVDFDTARAQIPATEHCIYMNTGWSGPLARTTMEAIEGFLEDEVREGPTTPTLFRRRAGILEDTVDAIASLINADPAEVLIRQSTTDGLNVIFNGLRWQPGDEIVTSSYEHSSVIVPLYYLRDRYGVVPRFVPLDTQDAPSTVIAKFEQAMSRRTRLLCISHVCYSNGMRLPLPELAKLAQAYDVQVLVDAAQGPGHLALDMQAMQPDYYAMPGQKWLLGPWSTGALYIRRDRIEQIEPTFVGGHGAISYDMEGHWEPLRDSVQKFNHSSVNHALMCGLLAAVRFQLDLGPQRIAERIDHLGRYATRRLGEIGPNVRVVSPHGELSTGLVCFQIEGLAPADIVAALWEAGKVVARQVRETESVRLSLHFFNTEAEIDRVAQLVADFAAHGLPTTMAGKA